MQIPDAVLTIWPSLSTGIGRSPPSVIEGWHLKWCLQIIRALSLGRTLEGGCAHGALLRHQDHANVRRILKVALSQGRYFLGIQLRSTVECGHNPINQLRMVCTTHSLCFWGWCATWVTLANQLVPKKHGTMYEAQSQPPSPVTCRVNGWFLKPLGGWSLGLPHFPGEHI